MDCQLQKNGNFGGVLAIGSIGFHPIFPIFSLNVHNNIAHKIVRQEFWFLSEASIGLRVLYFKILFICIAFASLKY